MEKRSVRPQNDESSNRGKTSLESIPILDPLWMERDPIGDKASIEDIRPQSSNAPNPAVQSDTEKDEKDTDDQYKRPPSVMYSWQDEGEWPTDERCEDLPEYGKWPEEK